MLGNLVRGDVAGVSRTVAGEAPEIRPVVDVEDDLADGRLVPALEDWATVDTTLYAIYPSRQYLAPKIKVFLDFVAQEFRQMNPAPHEAR